MLAPELRRELGVLARFGAAGLLNTSLGLVVILGLELGLGVERRLANAGGYVAGAVLALGLYRRFVFRGAVTERGLNLRYVAALAVAFAANQAMLGLAAALLADTTLGRTAAQVAAVATYTLVQFALMRLWVFRERG